MQLRALRGNIVLLMIIGLLLVSVRINTVWAVLVYYVPIATCMIFYLKKVEFFGLLK